MEEDRKFKNEKLRSFVCRPDTTNDLLDIIFKFLMDKKDQYKNNELHLKVSQKIEGYDVGAVFSLKKEKNQES